MPPPRTIALPDLPATEHLAAVIAGLVRRGDAILLEGPLGAGKSAFARAFLRAAAADPALEVPSPTFTLVQTYDLPDTPIWHFDLFRLKQPEDALELGIEDAFAMAISLIEWPERLGIFLPPNRLDLEIAFTGDGDGRLLRLTGGDGWRSRLSQLATTPFPA